MFKVYNMQVLAFNPAGDGPVTPVLTARTDQGLPGAPGSLNFTNIMLRSLNVSWAPPEEPNGIITHYQITYRQAEAVQGIYFCDCGRESIFWDIMKNGNLF